MLKGNLKKLISAAIAAATLLSSAAFAAVPAQMIVDVPSETLDSLEISFDDTEAMESLLTSLNGTPIYDETDGTTVTGYENRGTDILGWKIMTQNAKNQWTDEKTFHSSSNKYLSSTIGYSNKISNTKVVDFSKPFDMTYLIAMRTTLDMYIGKRTDDGDQVNDYLKINFTYSGSKNINTITISRVYSDGTSTEATAEKSWYLTMNAKLSYDGTKVKITDNAKGDIIELAVNSMPEGKISLISNHIYGGLAINSIKVERLATQKGNNDFYVALEDIAEDEATQSALANAGWSASTVSGFESGKMNLGGSGSIGFADATFSGDYSFEVKINYWFNSTNYYFNYVDAKNYYRLNVIHTYESKLYKCVDGTEIELTSVPEPDFHAGDKTIRVQLVNSDEGLTINMTSPTTLSYTDYTDDTKETVTSGEPLRNGYVGLQGVSNSGTKVQSFKIYPTAETVPTLDDITFDMYVDDVKVEGTTASKGVVSLAMPTKYAGRLNKVIVALYDNYEMQQVKVLDSIDFARADKIEIFDTTSCSSDAQIGIFMWNTLTSIKPLVQETIIDID